MVRDSGSWVERLPGTPGGGGSAADEPNGVGPREKWLFVVAMACIVVWGFSGPTRPPEPDSFAVAGENEQMLDRPRSIVPEAQRGGSLFADNGCQACHSLDGSTGLGPSLRGVAGHPVELADGSTVVADEAYLLESILAPQAKRVAGFDEVAMPSYTGLLTPEDARALVAFIKSVD